MSITVKQHLPAYFDHTIERKTWTFKNVAKMKAAACFKTWRDKPTFHRFSISDGELLMAELDGGKKFWVIGYIKADDPKELTKLPVWECPE